MAARGDTDTSAPSFLPLASPKSLWGAKAKSVEQLIDNPRRVAVDLLRLFVANRTPVILWGPVGSRKTRTIEALAREKDENGVPYQVITLQPSTQDPTIIHGMMYTSREGDETVMRRSIPHVAEQVMKYHEESGGLTVLFADEMTTCMPSQQNAMLGLLTHGKFEDADISQHIAIVMAANPEGTVSSVIPLNEAVLNRGGHLAWFGDRHLFVEEWSTGFNGATQAPRGTTVRLVESMFRQAPDQVFRSADQKWTTDSLVPWDMLEHTERAVTEMAKMIELVEDVFADAEPFIAKHYTVEVARALLGPRWSEHLAIALDQQEDGASKRGVVSWVREVTAKKLLRANSVDDLKKTHGSPWSEDLRHDQAAQVLADLTAGVLTEGVFSSDHHLGGWAFVCAAPDEGSLAGLSEGVARHFLAGRDAFTAGLLERDAIVPPFVPDNIKTLTREAVAAVVAQRRAASQDSGD